MARFIRQDAQVGSTRDTIVGFVDNTAPAVAMQTGAAHLADDLNNLRSIASLHLDGQVGNWYDDLTTPSALETGTQRGINNLNTDLHALEKKRVLRDVHSLVDVTVGAGNNFVILGTGELPTQTTAAVGAVTTLGTVVAAHGGTFGTHALSEVAGPSALAPQNLMLIVDGSTRDPILSGGRQIYGLLQGESGVTDGATITDTTTTRVQISFVRFNATGDDLEAVPFADIENAVINYCTRERVRLEDLNEADFLKGAIIDPIAGTTVDRQNAYTNQGATIVTTAANATLDLGSGLTWEIGDLASAMLFELIEGSAGGTSQFNIGAAVDEFDVDAVVNNFNAGVSMNTGGTRPIDVGVNDGLVETTAGDLEVKAAGELILNDTNMVSEATWTGPGVKVSETTAEVVAYETAFGGEVSLMNAIVQANNNAGVNRVDSIVTGGNYVAGTDLNGPGTAHANMTVDFNAYDNLGFSNCHWYLNGELLSPSQVAAGGTPSEGDLQLVGITARGTGTNPDEITQICFGTN